jgi:hypothetical protein
MDEWPNHMIVDAKSPKYQSTALCVKEISRCREQRCEYHLSRTGIVRWAGGSAGVMTYPLIHKRDSSYIKEQYQDSRWGF